MLAFLLVEGFMHTNLIQKTALLPDLSNERFFPGEIYVKALSEEECRMKELAWNEYDIELGDHPIYRKIS